eukprot:9483880-Pyramimonas_sp.AAC.1
MKAYGLFFCMTCGRTATADARHLSGVCSPPTRKGGENLRRIQKGLFPSYRGPPVSVMAAQTEDAVR